MFTRIMCTYASTPAVAMGTPSDLHKAEVSGIGGNLPLHCECSIRSISWFLEIMVMDIRYETRKGWVYEYGNEWEIEIRETWNAVRHSSTNLYWSTIYYNLFFWLLGFVIYRLVRAEHHTASPTIGWPMLHNFKCEECRNRLSSLEDV